MIEKMENDMEQEKRAKDACVNQLFEELNSHV
jgi:hypothetical protein